MSHYLAFLKESPQYSGTCAAADPKLHRYYKSDDITERSLEFQWEDVRVLQTVKYETLYCFTGWGLNSRREYRKAGSGT